MKRLMIDGYNFNCADGEFGESQSNFKLECSTEDKEALCVIINNHLEVPLFLGETFRTGLISLPSTTQLTNITEIKICHNDEIARKFSRKQSENNHGEIILNIALHDETVRRGLYLCKHGNDYEFILETLVIALAEEKRQLKQTLVENYANRTFAETPKHKY